MQQTLYLFLFLLIAPLTSSYAQTIIALEGGRIDYLQDTDYGHAAMSFLVDVNGDSCTNAKLRIKDGIPSSESEEESLQYALGDNDYVSIDSIKSLSVKDWEALLNGKSFILKRDDDKLITFSLQNDIVACVAQYDIRYYDSIVVHHQYNYEYNSIKTTFYNYAYLKLNKDKYILLLMELDGDKHPGINTIIPFADSLRIMQYKTSYRTPYLEEISSNTEYTEDLYLEYAYNIKPTENGKYKLTTKFHRPLPIEGDTIIFSDRHIIAYDKHDQLYTFYNSLSKPLPIPKARIYTENQRPLLLIDNDLLWIEKDTLTDIPYWPMLSVCGTVARYTDSLYVQDGNFYLQHYTDNYMLAREDVERTYRITNTEDVDSTFFYNKHLKNRYTANQKNDRNNSLLFIKKKNGKYNISNFSVDNSSETDVIALDPLLLQDCDSMEMNFPLHFQVGSLKGFYPVTTTARYAEIGSRFYTTKPFLRYRKPDGESGWLNMEDDKEYPDI